MSRSAAAVVGVPLFEEIRHLRPALESLLAQDAEDFAIVVVDDSVSDEPGEIVREYARSEPRLTYERNSRRLGLIENWRRAYEVARRSHPGLRYFAWAGHHDVWEPRWLSALVAVLDEDPRAVLAYPLSDRIGESGESLVGPRRFETRGTRSASLRLARTLRRMVAGEMVYGLFRSDALARCGVYRRVLMPDRLLLAELSILGEFSQVPELLWHRRGLPQDRYSPGRQRRQLFAGRPPLYTYLPWWAVHAAGFASSGALTGPKRAIGPLAGAAYLVLAPGLSAARVAQRAVNRRQPAHRLRS